MVHTVAGQGTVRPPEAYTAFSCVNMLQDGHLLQPSSRKDNPMTLSPLPRKVSESSMSDYGDACHKD